MVTTFMNYLIFKEFHHPLLKGGYVSLKKKYIYINKFYTFYLITVVDKRLPKYLILVHVKKNKSSNHIDLITEDFPHT